MQDTHEICCHEYIAEMHECNTTNSFWLILVNFNKYQSVKSISHAHTQTHIHTLNFMFQSPYKDIKSGFLC